MGFWLLMPNFTGFLIGFLLWGINSAFTSGTQEALVYDELKKCNKSADYTQVNGKITSIYLIGLILGSFAASFLASFGYNLILVLSIVSVLISAGCDISIAKCRTSGIIRRN